MSCPAHNTRSKTALRIQNATAEIKSSQERVITDANMQYKPLVKCLDSFIPSCNCGRRKCHNTTGQCCYCADIRPKNKKYYRSGSTAWYYLVRCSREHDYCPGCKHILQSTENKKDIFVIK
jgi:hypothetical protein